MHAIERLARAIQETPHSKVAWNELIIVTGYAKRVHADVSFGRDITRWVEMPTLGDIELEPTPDPTPHV